MVKRREWNLQQQARQIRQQIGRGESPQEAVSETLGGRGGTAVQQHGNDATTLGTGGADVHAGGGTAAGVAAVAGRDGAGEAEDIDNQNLVQMRAEGGGATNAIGDPGGDATRAGGAEGRASGSAMAARLVRRARGFATEMSDMLFRGIKKR